jgi:TolB-like protein/Tfp pilus assembly protein PilF
VNHSKGAFLAITVWCSSQIATREELRNRLWPAGTFVDFDHSLHNAIARLREALGDSADTPRFIETLPRRGYRFIASVENRASNQIAHTVENNTTTAAKPFPRWLLASVALLFSAFAALDAWFYSRSDRSLQAPLIHSLAVLPLENLSGNPNEEYFADGMTDELITDLAKIGSLRVISRTSSMEYKGSHKPLGQIARELKVDAVVEGSVMRSSNRVRITAQLIEAHNDRHLWAENYDRDLSDVVTLQNQIAGAIANEVQARLKPAEHVKLADARPVNPAAYEAYLKGRFHFNKRTEADLRTAVDYFNRAIATDPQYALAYVGLADSYNILGSWVFTAVSRDDARSKAMMFATKALEIDDTLGEAHTSLADAKLLFDCDWKGSEAEFQRALTLNPNYANAHHWYAELLIDSGRFDESLRESYNARQLDPLSAMMNSSLAGRLCAARRCDDAMHEALAALELDPNLPLVHSTLADIYRQQGKFAEAIAETRKAVQSSNNNPNFVAGLAYAYAVSGDRGRASEILTQLPETSRTRYVAPYQFSIIYSGLGDKRKALEALDQANEHSPWLNNL